MGWDPNPKGPWEEEDTAEMDLSWIHRESRGIQYEGEICKSRRKLSKKPVLTALWSWALDT